MSGCDLVHIQYQAAAFGLGGAITLLPWWLRLVRPKTQLVTTFHDLRVPYLFPRAGPLRAMAVKALLRGSHAAIFGDYEDLLAAGPGASRYWVPIGSNIPPLALSAAERERLRASLGVSSGEWLVGYFGFVNAFKGVDTLVQALAQLRAAGRPVRLALVGEQLGSSDATNREASRQLEALIAASGMTDAVVGTGWLSPQEVSSHLRACDVLALPFRDGASFRRGSLVAALAHGLPIVTTRPRGPRPPDESPYRLEDGRHALLVPPDAPAALSAAIWRVLDSPELRSKLSTGAAELGDRFSWPAIAQRTAEIYRQTLGRG